MKPNEVLMSLDVCFRAGQKPLLHGEPGVGKSQMILQMADKLFAAAYGYTVVAPGVVADASGTERNERWPRPWYREFRTSQRDAVDLMGVPKPDEATKATVWYTPDFLPTDPRGGVFFFDEINRGTPMTQNAVFSLYDRGEIGDYHMPTTWVMAAAMNDVDLGATKLSSAFSRRSIHIDVETSLEDVCKFAVQRDWAPETIAFLRLRPELLNVYAPKDRVSPNPRAWSFISELTKQGVPKAIEHKLFEGAVGQSTAIEYSGFLRVYKELAGVVDQVFIDPKKAPVPTQPASQYAIASALARRVTDRCFRQVLTYLERMPIEFNVMAVKDSVARLASLTSAPEFTKWCVAHPDVMF